jgi:hypothetical protein
VVADGPVSSYFGGLSEKNMLGACSCVTCFYNSFMCVYLRFLTCCSSLAGRVVICCCILVSFCVLEFCFWCCFLVFSKWISRDVGVP